MVKKAFTSKKGQALVELIISIALIVSFLTAFIVNLSFITIRFFDYQQKNFAVQIGRIRKEANDRNIAFFLASNKMVYGFSSKNYFPTQGSHLNYDFMKYSGNEESDFFVNQQKKFFFDEGANVNNWSFDGVPSNTTYILKDDDKGSSSGSKGNILCLGTSCQNVEIINRSKGRCVSNNCLRFFNTNATTASTVTFATANHGGIGTWEAWVNVTNRNDEQVFISRGENNFLGIVEGKPKISFDISGSIVTLTSDNQLQSNKWHHLVVSYDRATIKLYIDGVLDKTSNNVSGSIQSWGNLKFGYLTSESLKGFDGYLDEVKFYEKSLNSKEVENRYKAFQEQIGLLAQWHFDDVLNVANYSGISEVGTNPRFQSFSMPDNVPIYIEKAVAENNILNCKSGSCIIFNPDLGSKGELEDLTNIYPQFHEIDNIAISMKIKANNFSENYQGLFTKGAGGIYGAGLIGNDIQFDLNISGTVYSKIYDANLEAGKWYQIDFTYDGSNMKIYIDGILKESWEQSGTISNDTNHGKIYLGYSGAGNEYFNGYIDELKVYNRALSFDEINNPYNGAFTYYQYYKPVCRSSPGGVISSECLNCNPTSGNECAKTLASNLFEPMLIKSIHIVKYGSGINYKEYKNEQIIPIVNSFYVQEMGPNLWGGGLANYYGDTCGKFAFGQEGYSSGGMVKYNSICGDPEYQHQCGRYITGAEVCASENISFHYSAGCSDCTSDQSKICELCGSPGYFTKIDQDLGAYFISSTFNFPKKMSLASLFVTGTGAPIKFQVACLDNITDENGNEVAETEWVYMGPNATNSSRCSISDYYTASTENPTSISTCWETDNQSPYNCQFFRIKIISDPLESLNVSSIKINFGQYPYTILK